MHFNCGNLVEVLGTCLVHSRGKEVTMRIAPKISLLCLLILIIAVPATVFSDQLPAKMEKSLLPGITEISYAGENFVFNTTVSIHVSFTAVGPTRIELKFKVLGQRVGEGYIPSQENRIQIDWLDWNTVLFSGTPPADPWGVILDTEGGYTEK
jgi:hypothetical protein